MPDLVGAVRKVIARLAHPGQTLRTARARLMPKDPSAIRLSRWRHGNLPRVPITAVVDGLEQLDVTLLRAFDRVHDVSVDREELLALVGLVKATRPINLLEIGTY